MKKFLTVIMIFLLFFSFVFATGVLFDAGHAQTTSNADWVINGAYSDFGQALGRFFKVDQTTANLTPQLLQKYSVLVIPEPNDPFTWEEQDAIVNFIKNGGGVFFIADHEGADRNRNGWDAVSIFDEFVTKIGFEFEHDNMSQYPIEDVLKSPITGGVNSIGEWNGSTIKLLSKDVYPAAELYTHQIYVAYGYYGKGRFVAIGDSSPFDDGSGVPGKELYDGWHTGDDSVLAVNTVYWLSGNGATDTSRYLLPPEVVKVTPESSITLKIVFNKDIQPGIKPGVNVGIIGKQITSLTVSASAAFVQLSSYLMSGNYYLITRGIEDLYGNVSPLAKVEFSY